MSTDYSFQIYPLTIVRDRYNGVYSGAKFTAWHCEAESIPEGVNGDDVGCDECWDEIEHSSEWENQIGYGNTIDEAIEDLFGRLNRFEVEEEDKSNDSIDDIW